MKEHTFQIAINQKYRDKVKPGDGRFWQQTALNLQ